MITWTRLGYLGFMIPFALWGATAVIWGHMNFKAFRAAFVVAAVAVWFVGRRLNRGAEGENAPHQAWGLPMEWAGLFVSAAGLGLTFL
jgi:hypothetical protein